MASATASATAKNCTFGRPLAAMQVPYCFLLEIQKAIGSANKADASHCFLLFNPSLSDISPLHVGISLRSALKGTLSGSLSVTLADESWKSPLIEDKKYN